MAEREDRPSIEDFDDWKKNMEAGADDPREMFSQISKIAVCVSYDLVDKVRWWEKETLKLTDAEIEQRLPHLTQVLEKLKTAYVTFAEVDF